MADFFFISSSFAQWIIYVIVIVLLLSLFWVIQGVMNYLLEQEHLSQAKDNAVNISGRKLDRDNLTAALLQDVGNSLIQQRISRIYQSSNQEQLIDVQTLRVADEAKMSSSFAFQFIRFAKWGMLILGLLGVCFSLVWLAAEAPIWYTKLQLLNPIDPEYKRTVNAFFEPIRSAALCGFWGLFGTVCLTIAMIPFYRNKQTFLNQLDQFTNSTLIPLYQQPKRLALVAPKETETVVPKVQAQTNDQSAELTQLVQTVHRNTQMMNQVASKLQQVSAHIVKDFEHMASFGENFQASSQQQTEAQQQLHKDIYLLSQIVGGYKDQIDNVNDKQLKILQALETHNDSVESIGQKMLSTEFNFGDWLKQMIALSKDQQEDFREKIDRLLELTRSNLSNTQSMVNRFSKSIKDFEKNLESLQQHLSFFNSAIENASQNEIAKLGSIESQLIELNQQMNRPMMSAYQKPIPTQPVPMLPAQEYNTNRIDDEYDLTAMPTEQEMTTAMNTPVYEQDAVEQRALELAEQMVTDRIRAYEDERNRMIQESLENMETRSKSGGISRVLKNLMKSDDKK